METKRALDEDICAQKDAIEVIKREASNEANSLKDVIGTLDMRLQSTQRQLEQAIDVETRLRDTMSAEMREANARSSSGTLPQLLPQPHPIPSDFVAQIQDMMARERRETTTMLDSRLDAFSDLAETRNRNIRNELRLVKNELNFEQEDTSLSPPSQTQRSPTLPEHFQQLTSAQLATHEREHPAQEAVHAVFYETLDDTRASASADPWTAANLDLWRRPAAPVEFNIINKSQFGES